MIEARFFQGPMDQAIREMVTVFTAIDVYEPEGEYSQDNLEPFTYLNPAKSIWVYNLTDTDYSTYATYDGTRVVTETYITTEPGVWTAAGGNFDVLSDASTNVLVTPTDITFTEYGVTVRLAQRQEESK